jgi:segregation and condensation protein A
LKFSELFAGATSRTEVVVTFLALLELIRLKQLTAMQQEDFGDIIIGRANIEAVAPRSSEPPAVAGGEPETEPASPAASGDIAWTAEKQQSTE